MESIGRHAERTSLATMTSPNKEIWSNECTVQNIDFLHMERMPNEKWYWMSVQSYGGSQSEEGKREKWELVITVYSRVIVFLSKCIVVNEMWNLGGRRRRRLYGRGRCRSVAGGTVHSPAGLHWVSDYFLRSFEIFCNFLNFNTLRFYVPTVVVPKEWLRCKQLIWNAKA